ncbi:MAG: B12 lower ligand biosynthesis radical SAM protein BzaD [Nitrospiraceae bacterium]|nr:B12 lower ligand biosynthesis radical SAM protein BzaD [Nitrospiraceae bacterium]
MRVLMVQTPSVENAASARVYPIGTVLLATGLKEEGHETRILDMNLQNEDPFRALKTALLDFRPHAVGLSLRNLDPLANKRSSYVPQFAAAVRMTAALLPGASIIAGGTGFSLFPERLMRELPEIRYGVAGEAEYGLPALLKDKNLENPPAIEGLCLRMGDKIKISAPAREIDMAGYRPADKSLLDPAPYLVAESYVPAFGIESKRGCPFGCSYCVYPRLQGRRLRLRPPNSVVDEMEASYREFGVERFHFTDPVLNNPKGHLADICRELLRRRLRLKWDGFFREDLFDGKCASLYEKAGCECFSFSPDGLCREALEALGKKTREGDILKAARAAAKVDILSVYHFMVNAPGETEGTRAKAFGLVERLYALHAPKKNLGAIVLNNIRILPGTPIEEAAIRNGVIRKGQDLLYPVYYDPPPLETLRYELETLSFCKNVFSWQGE